MGRLGLIAGSSLHDAELPDGDWKAIRRHEVAEGYRLPHLIDHVTNLRALKEAGCDRVLAVSSVGGLRVELGLRYAALCVVDNLANGVGGEDLTLTEIERNRAENRAALVAALAAVLPALA